MCHETNSLFEDNIITYPKFSDASHTASVKTWWEFKGCAKHEKRWKNDGNDEKDEKDRKVKNVEEIKTWQISTYELRYEKR